ncbi:hypothetical protein J4229_02805 [Candidatus Pacearchaeota archaeon]|nr:hypothetical protein [Candidatus Pacearchaeota archaeon]
MKKNKKGVSQIVAVLLIILISVAAVAILSGFIVSFVRSSLEKSSECKNYNGIYTFDESFGWNCNSDNLYVFSIKSDNKNITTEIGGIKLILTRQDGTTESITIKEGDAVSSGERGIRMIDSDDENIVIPDQSGIESYVYNASKGEKFLSGEIYPVLKNGRTCGEIKELISINSCEKQII